MLFLGEAGLPTDSDELAAALKAGLTRWAKLPDPGRAIVQVSGGTHPEYDRLHIDLSGAVAQFGRKLPEPLGIGAAEAGFTVAEFSMISHPFIYQRAEVFVDLTAAAVRFNYDRNRKDQPVAVMAAAERGVANCRIAMADLEALLLRNIEPLVAGHGIAIERSELQLTSTSGRSIDARLRLQLSKQVFVTIRGVVLVTARLDIDDELNAVVKSIGCQGEGAVGSTIAGFAAPYLKRMEATVVPLSTFSLGEIAMRDVHVDCSSGLHIRGSFSG